MPPGSSSLPLAIALATQAWAGVPLQFEVIPPPSPPRLAREPALPQPPVPLGRGSSLEPDGRFDEPLWARTPPAPRLDPFLTGPAPPEASLKVALVDEGLAMALQALPAGATTTLVVDPDGLSQRWWRVEIGDEDARWQQCTAAFVPLPRSWYIPPSAVPCRDLDQPLTATRGGDGWELLWSWDQMRPATDNLRLLWLVSAPDGGGGTWAAGGGRGRAPLYGRHLVVPRPEASLKVQTDLQLGLWRATLDVEGEPGEQRWDWSVQSSDQKLEQGEVHVHIDDTGRGQAAWEWPEPPVLTAWVEARTSQEGPLARAAVGRTGEVRLEGALTTPVFTDHLEVSYRITSPITGLGVEVRDDSGAPLASGTVDLPVGRGRFRVLADPSWPAQVQLHVERLFPEGRAAIHRLPVEGP